MIDKKISDKIGKLSEALYEQTQAVQDLIDTLNNYVEQLNEEPED